MVVMQWDARATGFPLTGPAEGLRYCGCVKLPELSPLIPP